MPRKKQYQWDVETNGQEAPEQLSRSAKKRQSSALQDLGAELTKLPVNELDRLPLTPDLLEALRLYTRISNREGKRRQLQFIGRLMREVDAGPLAEAIEARKNGQQADAARLHLAEQWREKLLSAAEADVEDLLAAFPWPDAEAAGRPELEKLLAEARKEDDRRPPHARRALFRGICWNSVREFFWQGKGPLLEKGLPSPCTPIPLKRLSGSVSCPKGATCGPQS